QKEDYSDVIREAQEIVELCVKAMLRYKGIDAPKWHDVSHLLLEYQDLFPDEIAQHFKRVERISGYLRKEREFSFCGDVDFIPTEKYSREDAQQAFQDAQFVISVASSIVKS
ncbi:MAG: HEPN domain-containing protein, partial [Candidatus Atribacteria bacterium]|nr:HEPN domain-containing protein [Candidatus Atribacteria bacterium]